MFILAECSAGDKRFFTRVGVVKVLSACSQSISWMNELSNVMEWSRLKAGLQPVESLISFGWRCWLATWVAGDPEVPKDPTPSQDSAD